jgi:hypothetical protein
VRQRPPWKDWQLLRFLKSNFILFPQIFLIAKLTLGNNYWLASCFMVCSEVKYFGSNLPLEAQLTGSASFYNTFLSLKTNIRFM